MRTELSNAIWHFMEEHCRTKGISNVWQQPVVKFAHASHPLFARLKELVTEEHYLPQDYLPGASIVVSYFLPFSRPVAQSNVEHRASSPLWAQSYLNANAMAVGINAFLVDFLRQRGVEACVPTDAGMISLEAPRSRWSQRHVAYIAGHGTFGLNNMLISDKGSVGRYFSIITRLDVPADPVVQEERCLFKKHGACKLCVGRCFTGALTENGFDRFRCLAQCLENDALYPGADVCGKCVVELPCSRWSKDLQTKEPRNNEPHAQ